MKKFKFKLAQVLKYRLILEGVAKTAYQEALLDLQKKITKLNDLENKQINVRKGLSIKKGSQVDPKVLEFISLTSSF